MRPEVQALRALAVVLVLVFHLWPEALPGGYVGVDVFFVISGFLITAQLLREGERTGRVALAAFWARRARRLLPASLLVLAACTAGTVALAPVSAWAQFLGEVRASALYAENWHLAGAAVDYLAAADPPSPVQHFWSLSTEEQFYAAWPLLVAAALALAGGAGASPRRGRAAAGAVLGAATAGSLVYALHRTAADPAAAYFVTPARAWEFGAGGVLALCARGRAADGARRWTVLAWAGLAAIGVAALAYDTETPFPGVAAALPVLGTLAVAHAGMPVGRLSPARAFALAPVQRLGDMSYGVYLWHWPLLVLGPFALERPLTGADKAGVVVLTVALAAATKAFVEDPVRSGRLLVRRPPRWTFAASAAAVAGVVALGAAGTTHFEALAQEAGRRTAATLAAPPPCLGAASRDPQRPCRNPELRRLVVPTPLEARRRGGSPCVQVDMLACAFGAPPDGARAHVALVGDSHAGHWRAALAVVAERRRWHGLSLVRTGCALSTRAPRLPEPRRSRCARWVRAVPRWLARHPQVRTVFISQISGRDGHAAQVEGYVAAWRALPRTVERIVVLRDTPKTSSGTPACVERAVERREDAGVACAVPRARYLDADPAADAARRLRGDDRLGAVVDLTRVFCDERTCPAVIGGVLVHKDTSHITQAFSRTLGPLVGRALRGLPDLPPRRDERRALPRT